MAENEYGSSRITGLKELTEALKELPKGIAKNVLRGGVGAGAAVLRKEIKQRAPVYTGQVAQGHPPPGTLKRAVYQRQIRELSNAIQQTFFVGVRTGKKVDRKGNTLDAYYVRWVEYGSTKMTARPFIRPAFDAKKAEAITAVRDYMAERIPREVEKLKKGSPPSR